MELNGSYNNIRAFCKVTRICQKLVVVAFRHTRGRDARDTEKIVHSVLFVPSVLKRF